MKLSEAWRIQIDSDFDAISRVLVEDDLTTYCQAIAKSQQVVEKSVKLIDLLLQEIYVSSYGDIAFDKRHDAAKAIKRLLHVPKNLDRSVKVPLEGILYREWSPINGLVALAPSLPDGFESIPRNTEYPYHVGKSDWQCPALGFTFKEVDRHKATAERLRRATQRIASAILRLSVTR